MVRPGFLPALLASALLGGSALAQSPAPSPSPKSPPETKAQLDARMAWWRDAKFGMFIHWGVYSVPAGYYHGKPVGGVGEWIMHYAKIPMAEYQQFAPQFDPEKFNADQWVSMAKAAGVKYIVITAKHHDGFAMFSTKASTWNIMDRTKFHRDPLKELAAACRKDGMRLGFYYSQAQDWNNGGAAAGGKWDPAQQRSMDEYIDKIAVPQVRELLTNYGPDIPAVLWWDSPVDMNAERAGKLHSVVEQLRPGLITNNRLGGGYRGDTETPEQHIPARGYPGRDWESCMTINGTWGFKKDDQNFKPANVLLRNLIDIASKGGNYLLNVGPDSTGVIPQPEQDRLLAMGKWLKTNGEAIYGTTGSPFDRLPWGRATKKVTPDGAAIYLEVFNWPQDGKLTVPGLGAQPKSATLLAGGQTLPTASSNGDTIITVPAAAPDPVASVIKLDYPAMPQIAEKTPQSH
jgi:alpha-L-fucosidase